MIANLLGITSTIGLAIKLIQYAFQLWGDWEMLKTILRNAKQSVKTAIIAKDPATAITLPQVQAAVAAHTNTMKALAGAITVPISKLVREGQLGPAATKDRNPLTETAKEYQTDVEREKQIAKGDF